MDNSYQKYLKYKTKYFFLKNQAGGYFKNLAEEPIHSIFPSNCLELYMAGKGWDHIVKKYKAGKEITFESDKVCDVSTAKVPGLLLILGELRLKAIGKLINDTKKELEKEFNINYINSIGISAPGSTNLTSDYDLTITGKISSTFIWKFLELFVDRYKSLPTLSFDSNLYAASSSYNTIQGTMDDIKSKKGIKKITIDKKEYVFYLGQGTNDINSIHDFKWAFAKLYKNISEDEKNVLNPQMIYLLNEGGEIDTLCQKIFCENQDIDEVDKLVDKIYNKKNKSKTILKNYYYLCKLGEPLDKLYSEDIPIDLDRQELITDRELYPYINSVLGYSSLIKWLSSEAYYSNFTVYAIVLSLQLKYDDNNTFPKILWITAAIENLADLLLHMKHELEHLDDEIKKIKQTYIKYSKYVYRIVFCLTKAKIPTPQSEIKLKEVLRLRKTLDLVEAERMNVWKTLHSDNNVSVTFSKDGIEDWLNSMKKVYMKIFQDEIAKLYPGKISDVTSEKIIKL